jgi:hypothetical protein
MGMRFFVAALLAALSVPVLAQSGELWEITSQMNIPGMPAGMGAQTQRVCQGDDPARRAAAEKKGREECKVTDKKQSATRLQVTMVCKEGTMTIDQQYNAARTEFKGNMKMTSKDGEFLMNMTGRKVGACDVQQANREREEKAAAAKKQVEAGAAAALASQKQSFEQQAKMCTEAADKMDVTGFGVYGQCYAKKGDKDCTAILKSMDMNSQGASKVCNARVADFCKRYQTQEGFVKARGDERAAQMCGLSTDSIKAAQCPKAAQGGSLAFLGRYCPVEAKPVAQEHCAGRDYTSKMGGKYADFCQAYLANADFEKPAAQQPSVTEQAKDQVKQGINKLKGLFGR